MFDQTAFGIRLQESRLKRGLTQEEFAESVDISVSYLQKLERGAKGCSLDILVVIANKLCVTTDFLLTGRTSNIDLLKEAIRIASDNLQELALLL